MRLGIDLGGTKIEIIAMYERGCELLRRRMSTPQDYPGTLRAIADLMRQTEVELGYSGTVGIGTPGAISRVTGRLKNSKPGSIPGTSWRWKRGPPPMSAISWSPSWTTNSPSNTWSAKKASLSCAPPIPLIRSSSRQDRWRFSAWLSVWSENTNKPQKKAVEPPRRQGCQVMVKKRPKLAESPCW